MADVQKSLWVAVHTHEYGSDAYLFWFAGETLDEEAEERIVAALNINYEPERAESVTCSPVNNAAALVIEEDSLKVVP